MLAATTPTTADWVVGGIVIVVGLGIMVGIVWLLYRLVTWPARTRRRREAGGLGSEYEQMIHQQQQDQPRERRLPYPPPGGWQSPTAPPSDVSRVVLPPPGYRTREAETAAPEAELAPPTVVTNPVPVAAPAASSTWGRRMRTPRRIPAWVILPLAWLGTLFVFAFPIWGRWDGYGLGLVFAVAIGFWTNRRYHSTTLWRAEHNIVIWVRTGKPDDSLSPPVLVTPVALARPDSTPTSTETQPAAPAP